MLAAVIGPGNAVVRVSAEIDTEATTQTEDKYDPESQVIRSQTETEDVTNSTETRSGGGPVGVTANVPEKAQASQAAAAAASKPASTSEQNRKDRTTNYEINHITTNITRNPGSVKNVTAAVFIAQRTAPAAPGATGAAAEQTALKRTPEEINALRQIVINALGLKAAPGESLDSLVSLQEVPFQSADPVPTQIEAIQKEDRIQGWLDMASHWAAVGGAIAVLLVFWRLLSRQKPEPVPVEVLSMSPDAAARSLPNSNSVTPELLNELIRQKPANVGVALRDWVAVPAGKN
jgi:flagellar M-ring protein FliF